MTGDMNAAWKLVEELVARWGVFVWVGYKPGGMRHTGIWTCDIFHAGQMGITVENTDPAEAIREAYRQFMDEPWRLEGETHDPA